LLSLFLLSVRGVEGRRDVLLGVILIFIFLLGKCEGINWRERGGLWRGRRKIAFQLDSRRAAALAVYICVREAGADESGARGSGWRSGGDARREEGGDRRGGEGGGGLLRERRGRGGAV